MPLKGEEKRELLRKAELFAGLDAESLDLVAEKAQEMEFPAGRYIVRQGEIGTGFYILVKGRARVVRHDEEIDTMGPGECFGELSLLDHQPRTANVQATEPTVCLALASWDFTKLLEQEPRLTLGLLRQVVQRIRPYLSGHRH